MSIRLYLSSDVDSRSLMPFVQQNGFETSSLPDSLPEDSDLKIVIGTQLLLQRPEILRSAAAVFLLLRDADDCRQMEIPENSTIDYCVGGFDAAKLQNLIEIAKLKLQIREMQQQREADLSRLKELNNIGVALSTQKDPVQLLNLILQKSREITSADAGSLYLVEGDEESGKELRFKILQNDSMSINYEEFTMPITPASIAGYVASTGQFVSIPDAYQVPAEQPFVFNRQFDERTGYRTTSILAVPMKNRRGDIIGIIQLINKKKDFNLRLDAGNWPATVQPFETSDEELVSSLASQAAVALENSMLIKSIRTLFEGFVTAAVTAIESRDPTTSGHSFRVANLTVGLATTVNRIETGKLSRHFFTDDQVKEMRYAALLHDFGKVGVRENVLVKAKKLYPYQIDLIKQRFALLRKAWEAEYYKSRLNLLLNLGKDTHDQQTTEIESLLQHRLEILDNYLEVILQSNEPTVMPEGNFEKLLRISADQDIVPPGVPSNILSTDEVRLLSIRKGSLNDQERLEIQSHVTHTFAFLNKIPWTSELKSVPAIAYGHHEKLDGSGYPNRLKGDDIPVQTRIMTISDIFDALTASDRPYKPAVPLETALDILSAEVKQGQIDADLFQLFVEAKIFELSGAVTRRRPRA